MLAAEMKRRANSGGKGWGSGKKTWTRYGGKRKVERRKY